LARFYGRSGCTALLVQGLRRYGIQNVHTLEDVQQFRKNFNQIVEDIINNAKIWLSDEITLLKNKQAQFIEELKSKISLRRTELLYEKEQLIERINSESRSKKPKRLKVLEAKFDKILEKPFKKDKKQINKIRKKSEKLEIKYDKIIAKKTKKPVLQMNKSKSFLDLKSSFLSGAIGEETVIKELVKLPDSYIVFNDMNLSFSKSIRWKKYNEYVKSCQIDHVVIGPNGIFLIETKNWKPETLQTTRFLPHKQVDRAGYIFFIKFINLFRRLNKKIPIRGIVVTLRDLPKYDYPYVEQLTPNRLDSYILGFRDILTLDEVEKISNWLMRSS
jgi:vacuolar-type H+-ATPase subunit H